MFRDNKENAKLNLQGRLLKSFIMILVSMLSFLLFAFSCAGCLYLLVINTELLAEYGVFENQYILCAVCALSVAVNIILLLFHIYLKLKKDIYFYCFDESDKIRFSLNSVCKALSVYTLNFIKTTIAFIFFMSPFLSVLTGLLYLLQSGVSYFVLTVFVITDFVFLATGFSSYLIFIQKYHLLPLILFENQEKNIREIFRLSAEKMNGICKDTAKLKIFNLPKRVACLFIVPMVYYLPLCRATESDFALQKEIPYMRKKAYTEKPIVFYFKQIKEN